MFLKLALPVIMMNIGTISTIGGLMTFGGFVGASLMKGANVVENVNGVEVFKTANSKLRLGLYGMGVLGLGLATSPYFLIFHLFDPTIIPRALSITTAFFGGASIDRIQHAK